MKDYYYDKLLNIHTNGKETPNSISHYYPYEPTPYMALETLFAEYELSTQDHVVDFGCGLGRLNFYIHYYHHASVVGIELNEHTYQGALQNLESYKKRLKHPVERMAFECCRAEEYAIKPSDNCFYFFNPFSVAIFQKVVRNILLSVEENPRKVAIILYYPSVDYIQYLELQSAFELVHEIPLSGYIEKNPNERFLVYRLKF